MAARERVARSDDGRIATRADPYIPTILLVAIIFVASLLSAATPAHAAGPFGSTARYAVIMVLDGARPGYFNLAKMPNLRWLMRHGTVYKRAIVGQMIADTPPSHATIGSGLFPKHNGVLGFWWKDPQTDTLTRPTDTDLVESGALERVLTDHHAPSIASQVHASDPSAQVVSVAGHKCYAADAMGGAAANDILCALIYHDRWVAQAMGSHRPPPGAINNPRFDYPIPNPKSGFAPAVEQWNLGGENDWTIQYALWAFHRIHYPRVLMMNLGETDVLGHFALNPHRIMASLMRKYDLALGRIIAAYRAAGILNQTDFVITADHGMSRVRARIPIADLKQAIQMAGTQQVFIEGDTAATIGIADTRRSRAVALNVAHLGGTAIDATYYASTENGVPLFRLAYARRGLSREVRRAYTMLVNTDQPDAGGDVIVIYAPHVTTGDRIANGYHWLAGHLGPQWDEQHIPLVIAGAGIRHQISSYPARLVDIAPTVETLLGANTGHVDGHVLADALQHSTPSERTTQARIGSSLTPLVAAIQARSSGHLPHWDSTASAIVTLPAPPSCSGLRCQLDNALPALMVLTAFALLAFAGVWFVTRRGRLFA